MRSTSSGLVGGRERVASALDAVPTDCDAAGGPADSEVRGGCDGDPQGGDRR